MKKLIIWRHAKSSWEDLFLSDHQRPLAPRGLRDTPDMANRLKKRKIYPDLILSSDATRAYETAKISAGIFDYPLGSIHTTPSLYHAGARSILNQVRQVANGIDVLFVFGHNPGLTDFINLLGEELDNLPTCGQFGFTANIDSWRDFGNSAPDFWFFDFPKSKITDI